MCKDCETARYTMLCDMMALTFMLRGCTAPKAIHCTEQYMVENRHDMREIIKDQESSDRVLYTMVSAAFEKSVN